METASILLVDDESELLGVLQESLLANAYRVCGAASAEEALSLLERERFSVVLTDFYMPSGISGLDLVEALKAKAPDVVCIVMTGHTTVELAIQALKRGAYDFISKPFRLEELCRVLDRALDYAGLLRQVKAYQASLETRLMEQVATSRSVALGFQDLASRLATAMEMPTLEASLNPLLDVLDAWYQPTGLALFLPTADGGWRSLLHRGPEAWANLSLIPAMVGEPIQPDTSSQTRHLAWPGPYQEGFVLDLGGPERPLGRLCLGFAGRSRLPGEDLLLQSWKVLLEVVLRAKTMR